MTADALPSPRRPARGRTGGAAPWEAPRTVDPERRARRRAALGRLLLVLFVAGALASVVWRQTEGVARQRELSRVQAETSIAEAERVEWANRIQALQTRARITRVANRLGLHVARDEEVILLPVAASAMEQAP